MGIMEKKIAVICFEILLFFTFFGSILSLSILPAFPGLKLFLTFLRYGSYFYICVLLFKEKRISSFSVLGRPFIYLFIYFLFIGLLSLPDFLTWGVDGFKHYKQIFIFLLLFDAYYNYEKLTGKKQKHLLSRFVFWAVLFSVVNISLFISAPPFVNKIYVGRFSVGYPTEESVILSMAFAVVLYSSYVYYRSNIRLLFTIVLFLQCVLLFTGSGTVFLILILAVFPLSVIRNLDNKIKKQIRINFLKFIISILILFGIGLSYCLKYYPEIVEISLPVVENRLLTIMGKESNSSINTNTQELRNDQYLNHRNQYQRTLVSKTIGIGFGPVSDDLDKYQYSNRYIFIEDQYKMNLVTIGFIGSSLYIIVLLSFLLFPFKHKFKLNDKILYVLIGLIYMLSNKNICAFDMYGTLSPYLLIWSTMIKDSENN